MNKDELNQKLSDLEAEAEKLRSLINAPEPRKPEAGDVYLINSGHEVVYSGMLPNGYTGLYVDGYPSRLCQRSLNDCHYLGKFDEVYVKISDVREAISHKDQSATREALRKLNIITD